jgi:hypothetical protein
MGISWHTEDYRKMVLEIEEYFTYDEKFRLLDVADIHDISNKLVNIMIDHGAVDPS